MVRVGTQFSYNKSITWVKPQLARHMSKYFKNHMLVDDVTCRNSDRAPFRKTLNVSTPPELHTRAFLIREY
jgi:hypothetical protein